MTNIRERWLCRRYTQVPRSQHLLQCSEKSQTQALSRPMQAWHCTFTSKAQHVLQGNVTSVAPHDAKPNASPRRSNLLQLLSTAGLQLPVLSTILLMISRDASACYVAPKRWNSIKLVAQPSMVTAHLLTCSSYMMCSSVAQLWTAAPHFVCSLQQHDTTPKDRPRRFAQSHCMLFCTASS